MNIFFVRKFVIQAIFISVGAILLMRLFYIQVIDKSYFFSAENNVFRKVIIYPARGVILDRKGKILVENKPVYDIMVTPREVKPFDTLELCRLLGIDRETFYKSFNKAKTYSPYRPSVLIKQLSAETYGPLSEKLYQFPGFYAQNRTVRFYPDSIASQFLGYINEVNEKDIENSGGFYRPGDYHGVSGVERAYEEDLRGQRGVQIVMVDAFNREKGHFADGLYDTVQVAGENLISSLDKDLQKLGERLMQNKRGSIVAIEPSTGEILACVSSPGYNPNIMVGRQVGNNYMKLLNDPDKPLFIRPIQAEYPPGSIFKVIDALVGQQFGMIDSTTHFYCPGGYSYGRNGWLGCTHIHGSIDLKAAIQESCNTYFANVYNRIIDHSPGLRPVDSYKRWRNAVIQFGIGSKLNVDLPHEQDGLLPTDRYYTKNFRSDKWTSGYNISLSIGQGELEITPLQMANVMAIVANKGFYYMPHLIKAIGKKAVVKPEFTKKNAIDIDFKYYEPVIEGMSRAVNRPGGTAYETNSMVPGIEMCGKTGTVQNNHGANHSVFLAFAPRVNPKIAIAVIVENAGFGATWSAPMASLMVEQYLKDSITRPKYYIDRLVNGNFLGKSVNPRPAKKDSIRKVTPGNKPSLPGRPLPKSVSTVAVKVKEDV
jgi:penicillin-binding protein 2